MTTINLYQNQEDVQRKNSARVANGGFFFSLGILVLTLVALLGIKIYEGSINSQNLALQSSIKAQNTSLAGVSSLQRILDMQARLSQIKTNLQIKNSSVGQLKMTNVLDQLGSAMSSGTVVSSYSYDDSGKIKVIFSANDFNDVARQILNFKKSTYFSNVAFNSDTQGKDGIVSNMTMEVKNN